MKDYIAELVNPDIHLVEEGKILHYRQEDLRALSKRLSSLRQAFLSRLSEQMNKQVSNAYLLELKQIVEGINIYRLDFPITNARLFQMNFDGQDDDERRKEQKFLSERILDKYILRSAQNTIDFLEKLLSDGTVAQVKKENNEKDDSEQKEQMSKPVEEREWLNLDEVCDVFRLSRNSVKSRKWRKENGFPIGNDEAYARLVFSRSAVQAWMEHKKC